MNKKDDLKKRIFDKDYFNSLVDKTFQDADLNKSDYIERDELAIVLSYYISLICKKIKD